MYLRRQHIEGLARAIAKALPDAHGVTLQEAQPRIEERVVAAIEANLAAEQRLEDDAEKLMKQQLRAAGGGADIDQSRALQLIKKELAKKKGFIL